MSVTLDVNQWQGLAMESSHQDDEMTCSKMLDSLNQLKALHVHAIIVQQGKSSPSFCWLQVVYFVTGTANYCTLHCSDGPSRKPMTQLYKRTNYCVDILNQYSCRVSGATVNA